MSKSIVTTPVASTNVSATSAATPTGPVDTYAAVVTFVRAAASKAPHAATSEANREPRNRASKVASAVNARFYTDPTTYAVRNEYQAARILALMAREGITFAG